MLHRLGYNKYKYSRGDARESFPRDPIIWCGIEARGDDTRRRGRQKVVIDLFPPHRTWWERGRGLKTTGERLTSKVTMPFSPASLAQMTTKTAVHAGNRVVLTPYFTYSSVNAL